MKYAFMSFSCPELTLEEMLALAKRLGYDGIEPRMEAGHKHGVETDADANARREIYGKVVDSGIAMCCIATSRRYADPATVQQEIDETLRCIDLAGDVGASRLRVFGGPIPEGVSREQAIDGVANAFIVVADRAADRGVTLCMETHDDWCDPAHVAEVMRRADHPAIAVNWDIMHPVLRAGWTMDDAFRTLSPWTRHVHFHDGVKTDDGSELRPVGEGEVDHGRAVQLLRDAEYNAYLSGEWINWEPHEVHLPRELAAMKRL